MPALDSNKHCQVFLSFCFSNIIFGGLFFSPFPSCPFSLPFVFFRWIPPVFKGCCTPLTITVQSWVQNLHKLIWWELIHHRLCQGFIRNGDIQKILVSSGSLYSYSPLLTSTWLTKWQAEKQRWTATLKSYKLKAYVDSLVLTVH